MSQDGKILTLNEALTHSHYGGEEYQSEVILLSRSIKMMGHKQGNHFSTFNKAHVFISGVESFQMGSQNDKGTHLFIP